MSLKDLLNLKQILLFTFLYIGSLNYSTAQCTGTTNDCDGDGILNDIDVDDDNDGILDIEEYGDNFIDISPTSLGFTTSSVGYIDIDQDISSLFGLPAGSVEFDMRNVGVLVDTVAGTSYFQVRQGSVNCWMFIGGSAPARLRVTHDPFIFGEASEGVYAIEDEIFAFTGDLSANANITLDTTYRGSTEQLRINNSGLTNGDFGTIHTWETLNRVERVGFLANHDQAVPLGPNSFNIAFAVFKDTDNDGVYNYLDNDSDNDGCPDALEGSIGDFTLTDIDVTTLRLTGAVDTNGVPIAANGGQMDSSSTNARITSDECDDDNDGVVNSVDKCPGFDDTVDNDNDSIPDGCDQDDDNDGILDMDECPEGTNFALNGTATLNSVRAGTAPGSLAIDGNRDGFFFNGSVAHTEGNTDYDWLTIDLDTSIFISNISFWNRQDGGTDRLSNVYVMISETPFTSSVNLDSSFLNAEHIFQLGDMTGVRRYTVPAQVQGRYIRVQKAGFYNIARSLNIAEVEVYGVTPCDYDNDSIRNTLDLDSDNDGCVDALEGDNTGIMLANIDTNDRLISGINVRTGVPTIVGVGQIDSSSTDSTLTSPSCDDDGDMLPNGTEITNGTDPLNPDTDGDGVGDATDVSALDPCLPQQVKDYTNYVSTNTLWMAADCDGDGINNGVEFTGGNDPYDPCDPDPFAISGNGCVDYITIGPLKAGDSTMVCIDTSWIAAGPITATNCDGSATGTLASGSSYSIDSDGCLNITAPTTVSSSSVDSICIRICDANGDCKTTVLQIGITSTGEITTIDSIPPGDSVQVCLDTSWVLSGPVIVTDCDGNTVGTTTLGGSYTIDSDGCVNYNSDASVTENSIDSICISICDGVNCDSTIITIPVIPVRFMAKVLLQGAMFNGIGPAYQADGLMRDDLRDSGFIPAIDPYTANPLFTHAGDGGQATASLSAFDLNGANSVVDWVFIQFRAASDSTNVVETMSLLVQRDGDIVDVNGVDPFVIAPKHIGASYYVSVRHRNHLGVMTSQAVPITKTGTIVDFTDINGSFYSRDVLIGGSSFDYSDNIMADIGSKFALYAGNASHDNKVKYSTDYNQLFADVVSAQSGSTIILNYDNANGYFVGDLNMDGKVKYQGSQPDGLILSNQVLFSPINEKINENFDFFLEMLPSQN